MKTILMYSVSAVAAAVLIGLSGCPGMSTQDKDTAIGVGVGGVAGAHHPGGGGRPEQFAGAALGGGVVGTAAGAVVGGVIGHEVGKPK